MDLWRRNVAKGTLDLGVELSALTKATVVITTFYANFYQNSASRSRPNLNFNLLTKDLLQNPDQTSTSKSSPTELQSINFQGREALHLSQTNAKY